jgi:DNA-binding MarR family transcriptional regulator
MPPRDAVDALVGQWAEERPDLDIEVMAIVGRLLRVAQLIERRLEAFAAAHGLDRGQGDVLLTLRRSGAPFRLSPTALAGALLVTSGTMTNRLDRLEARGLVRRRPNPEDRRGLAIELTEKGRRLVDELVGAHVEHERELIAPLTARDREQLVRITRKLLAHLSGS